MNKICSKCKKEFPIDYFSPDKMNSDGYKGRCKSCINEYQHNYIKNNPQSTRVGYPYVKARRERIKKEYGFGGGLYWRYGLDTLIAVFDKYNKECNICQSKKNLTIHHKDSKGRHYNEKTGNKMNNELSNLELLCRKCHGAVDGRNSRGVKPRVAKAILN